MILNTIYWVSSKTPNPARLLTQFTITAQARFPVARETFKLLL